MAIVLAAVSGEDKYGLFHTHRKRAPSEHDVEQIGVK